MPRSIMPHVSRHKEVSKGMLNIQSLSRIFFMNSIPKNKLKWTLENVIPLIERFFSKNKVPDIQIAGRLKGIMVSWI